MRQTKDFEFIDKAVYFPNEKIAAIADLHLGFEQALNALGFMLPREQYKKIIADCERIFNETGKLKEIIILGDLKHEFGTITGQEWKEVTDFLEFLAKYCDKIVLVKGNHDTILEPIARKKNLELVDFYVKGENCFIHGHKTFPEVFDKKIKRIFIGHKHPAITISRSAKRETFKCFLKGKWKDKEIVILPSFFPLTEGSDIYVEDTNLALKLDLKDFEVYAVGDKVYGLGKVKDVGRVS